MVEKKEKRYVSDNAQLMAEWNWKKNDELNLNPKTLTVGSERKLWWKCSKGHEWQAMIYHRNNGRGCPICNSERNTSFPEYALVFYLKKYNIEVIHSYKELGCELDIYLPTKKVAIEYDGYYWHKNKGGKDLEKNFICEKAGIRLYRIREELPSLNSTSIDYVVQKDQKDLSEVLGCVLRKILGTNIDVDVKRDSIEIENLREYSEKENSILFSNPELATEWNYERNGKLKPENISIESHKKVWWKCNKGHEWQAVVKSRKNGVGCPYCSGRYTIKGESDLQTVNPTLAKEWNYEKNNVIKPSDVMSNSEKKVWWKCSNGHEWQAVVASRNKGRKCPYCSGKKVLKGYNDLQTVNPILAKEWDYEKNDGLTPMDVMANSNKKVWWVCDKGHEWQAQIYDRNKGVGCPYCSGRYAIKGETDLQTVNPTLAKEWNYEKNNGLLPIDVSSNSSKKVWWKCSRGHEWQATIAHRNYGNGCPYCSGRYVVKGENDLYTMNPRLAKEWNYEKNSNLSPEDFTPNSGVKVWWKCNKGHEWQAVIKNRNKGSGCPYCYRESRGKTNGS